VAKRGKKAKSVAIAMAFKWSCERRFVCMVILFDDGDPL
jgi:hypothetical protein